VAPSGSDDVLAKDKLRKNLRCRGDDVDLLAVLHDLPPSDEKGAFAY